MWKVFQKEVYFFIMKKNFSFLKKFACFFAKLILERNFKDNFQTIQSSTFNRRGIRIFFLAELNSLYSLGVYDETMAYS
jgi:hypothetical protein